MFKDVKLSEEMMATYKQYLAERRESEGNDASGKEMAAGHSSSNDLDLYVTVLSSADWPTYLPVEVIVPEDMDRALQAYNQYYTSKHPRRGLQWRHQLGHCVVRARFKSGVKELIVSAFQAFVLLVFNGRKDNEHLGYAEIQASTGLCKFEIIPAYAVRVPLSQSLYPHPLFFFHEEVKRKKG
jgi:cullin-4